MRPPRSLVLLLAFTLVLAGCGQDRNGDGDTDDPGEQPTLEAGEGTEATPEADPTFGDDPASEGLKRWTLEWLRRIREVPELPPEDVIPPPLPEWPGETPPPEAMLQAQTWVDVCTNGVAGDDPFPC